MKMYWKHKRPEAMTTDEWEALCDRCGLCCLHKVRYKNSDEVLYTAVACRLLGIHECRCLDYPNRRTIVPDCLMLTLETLATCEWLPKTCAYRLVWEGKDLPDWHYLISGDRNTVHEAGASARDKAISENYVSMDNIAAYVIDADIL